MKKYRVGILGATGMVGQHFITLLKNHPWFKVVVVAASNNSRGKKYVDAVKEKWKIDKPIPEYVKSLSIFSVKEDLKHIVSQVDFVFCCLGANKEEIKKLEEAYACLNVPVISSNSAHRWTQDIPMIIPEVNPEHLQLITIQRKNRGWNKGCIVVKPNCSIQSYVAILTALKAFEPIRAHVVSLQAVSGAGKTLNLWPEMVDTVIPFIKDEEEKSEKEPLKIWGNIAGKEIEIATYPQISAACVRVPVSNGHMAVVSVSFKKRPSKKQVVQAIQNFKNPITNLHLPSSPKEFIHYFENDDRPQIKIDRDFENGMGISMGRLQEDKHFDFRFVSLSHNTIRGAAGGAILTAELMAKKGYI